MFSEMSSCQFRSINNLTKQSLGLFSCGALMHRVGPLIRPSGFVRAWIQDEEVPGKN